MSSRSELASFFSITGWVMGIGIVEVAGEARKNQCLGSAGVSGLGILVSGYLIRSYEYTSFFQEYRSDSSLFSTFGRRQRQDVQANQ